MKTILLLVCGLLMGCATQPRVAPKAPVTLTDNEADIYETVLRHQFTRNASATQQSAGSYFIQIQDADPSDTFLHRFSGETPLVKRASEARHARDSGIYDRETGKMSLIFEVGAIRWHGNNSVEVDGGYYEGDLSASGNTYRLTRRGNKWKVLKDTMSWISDSRPPLSNGRNA